MTQWLPTNTFRVRRSPANPSNCSNPVAISKEKSYERKHIMIMAGIVVAAVTALAALAIPVRADDADELERIFMRPPEVAKPGMLWFWMGCNPSRDGFTRDLRAFKTAGFNRPAMFHWADVTTPWSGEIGNSPTPEIVSWTEPWWMLARHAAEESRRLGMDFGMGNGTGYESSGGP